VNRRSFLKLGALFVPAVAAPTVVYSFLWARQENWLDRFVQDWNIQPRRAHETDEMLKTRFRFLFTLSPPAKCFGPVCR